LLPVIATGQLLLVSSEDNAALCLKIGTHADAVRLLLLLCTAPPQDAPATVTLHLPAIAAGTGFHDPEITCWIFR
jgi:hypothetical protein